MTSGKKDAGEMFKNGEAVEHCSLCKLTTTSTVRNEPSWDTFFTSVLHSGNSDSRVSDGRCRYTPRRTHIFLSVAHHIAHSTCGSRACGSTCLFCVLLKRNFIISSHGFAWCLTVYLFILVFTTSTVTFHISLVVQVWYRSLPWKRNSAGLRTVWPNG